MRLFSMVVNRQFIILLPEVAHQYTNNFIYSIVDTFFKNFFIPKSVDYPHYYSVRNSCGTVECHSIKHSANSP